VVAGLLLSHIHNLALDVEYTAIWHIVVTKAWILFSDGALTQISATSIIYDMMKGALKEGSIQFS
jgi:hypothetical protein